jgi:hypothetical protein
MITILEYRDGKVCGPLSKADNGHTVAVTVEKYTQIDSSITSCRFLLLIQIIQFDI